MLDNISGPQNLEKFLPYGTKDPVQTKVSEQHFLANIDILLSYCKSQKMDAKVINQITSLMVGYTNKMQETRQNGNYQSHEMSQRQQYLSISLRKGYRILSDEERNIHFQIKRNCSSIPIQKKETNLLLNVEKKFGKKTSTSEIIEFDLGRILQQVKTS